MPRPIRLALILLGGWIAACELHALGLTWIPVGNEKWLHLVVMAAGAGLCLLRAAVKPKERLAWLLLGLGVLAWDLGELYFTVVLWNDSSPPVPSPADAGYLSLPPLVFAGLIVLARERVRGLPRTLWIDGITAGLAAGAVSASLVFKPVLAAIGGRPLSVATNLAYPVSDLLMLGLICGVLAAGGRRLDRRFLILALGILCFWGADTTYLVKSAEGTWVSGGPYDPGWWTISICFAVAAWVRPGARRRELRRPGMISIPIIFAVLSLAILVAGTITDVSVPAVALASGALLSVLVRLVVTFHAHQAMLERSRSEALTDPLTGLGNRRALWNTLHARLEDDGPDPVTLALMDLNGFKSYNDRFGHAAGDQLLRRLADKLAAALGPSAAVFRMGGDEFCALIPAGVNGARMLPAATLAMCEHGDGFSISAAIGIASFPDEAADPENALRLADERMYADKSGVRRNGAAQEVKQALLSVLAQRDPELSGHVDDVAALAEATAAALGCPPASVESVRLAAELHDIGKMAIPEDILRKPGRLSEPEWALMRQHTIAGERILRSSPALTDIAPLIRASHERWDGKGYPDHLSGESIPFAARVIAVCDSYHAMTSDRSYRKAMSSEVALAELRACSGTQFDPRIVDAFLRLRTIGCEQVVASPAA